MKKEFNEIKLNYFHEIHIQKRVSMSHQIFLVLRLSTLQFLHNLVRCRARKPSECHCDMSVPEIHTLSRFKVLIDKGTIKVIVW